jgi:hypothetical protein
MIASTHIERAELGCRHAMRSSLAVTSELLIPTTELLIQ